MCADTHGLEWRNQCVCECTHGILILDTVECEVCNGTGATEIERQRVRKAPHTYITAYVVSTHIALYVH